jgi:site-specific DNA-methyltransferase (adenine-specific)
MTIRKLYFGDNLEVMRESLDSKSVDLIYLDPPFNSKKNYNVIYKSHKGVSSQSQTMAFVDSWNWNDETSKSVNFLITEADANVGALCTSILNLIGQNGLSAYLIMMLIRLVEMRRILKDTGSIYLHCDPSASHYLKIMMDKVFGMDNFMNEIIWKRTSAHSGTKGWGRIHDVILFYAKSDNFIWNKIYQEYTEDYANKFYNLMDEDGRRFQADNLMAEGLRTGDSSTPWRGVDPSSRGSHWAIRRTFLNDPDIPESTIEALEYLDSIGRIYWPRKGDVPRIIRYLDEMPGGSIQEVITDISPLSSRSKEKLGYPTQKPLALLEIIIQASSNTGGVILDPFCGCGTAIEAAERLNRQWIGIDVTHLAIALVEKRMKDAFRNIEMDVHGTPKDFDAAKDLAERNKYQFQWWACSLVNARPYGDKVKGADKGIDGVIFFIDDLSQIPKKIIVAVKGGQSVTVSMIRDLVGVIEREKAAMGYFITLAEPTKPMLTEAAGAGTYISDGKSCPKVQILTIEKLLNGIQPIKPKDLSVGTQTFKTNQAQAKKRSVNKGNKIFD